MPLDPRVKRFVEALATGNAAGARTLSVAERRAGLVELLKLHGPPIPLQRRQELVLPGPGGPIPVRVYSPPPALAGSRDPAGLGLDLPGLIYFHGGGLLAGSLDTHDGIAGALADAGQCRVMSIGYRLAPEHPYPAAAEDALAAVHYIRGNAAALGIDVARLGICGDSAGGALAAMACQQLARRPERPLALQLLICPVLDYGSGHTLASGHLMDQATLDHDVSHYVPAGVDPADPRISPLRAAELAGLPPTVIHTAEFDPLRPQAQRYSERLREAGIVASCTSHAGMIHLFYGLQTVIPYARVFYEQIGAHIKAGLAPAPADLPVPRLEEGAI